ncbi:MAG TPA: ribosomal protein S18-alanine N-acetyltransferase [Pyrinomonadaceae bacterium]|nr:ribosomal protein S18-alanine N-acetyltransferase [Pyrinomonadaceae bacterium]
MAFLDKIFGLFVPTKQGEPEIIVSAPMMAYEISPLTEKHLKEVLKLNLRCFKEGENYTKHTFAYLLNEPNCLSYQLVTPKTQMVGFIFVMVENGIGHITTIGVAPEHRRRGLAQRLLTHAEKALQNRNISTVTLEVRVGNSAAHNPYRELKYSTVQRIKKYYNNGEDGFLMVKSLF